MHAISDAWERNGLDAGLRQVIVPTLRELLRHWNSWTSDVFEADISGDVVIDLAEGPRFRFRVVGDVTSFTFINTPEYPVNYIFDFMQDATGGRILPAAKASWPGSSRFLDGTAPEISTDANSHNFAAMYWDQVNYHWGCVLGPVTE